MIRFVFTPSTIRHAFGEEILPAIRCGAHSVGSQIPSMIWGVVGSLIHSSIWNRVGSPFRNIAFFSNMLGAWKATFSQSFNWRGRASRTEFWYWQLLLLFLTWIPVILLATALDETVLRTWTAIAGIILFCPTLGLLTRRVHDFNWSGWTVLLLFVVGAFGFIIQFILGLIPGTKGPNKYGFRSW